MLRYCTLLMTCFMISASSIYASDADYQAFTGKVTNQRVRLRTEPHTDSPIVKELNRGDMFIIVGETDDFYAVKPAKETKAYIYRTFVIDNTIEGNKVNVRLQPSLESPVIAQLNTGDKVQGSLNDDNNRWFEITPPETTRFYIAKDFIEKAGDSEYLVQVERKRQEVQFLLNQAQKMGQEELQKPFESIELEETLAYLDRITNQYEEFPSYIAEAKKTIAELKQDYLQKKIQYLETRVQTPGTQSYQNSIPSEVADEIKVHQEELVEVERELQGHQKHVEDYAKSSHETEPTTGLSPQMNAWIPVEEEIFLTWLENNHSEGKTKEDFYAEQNRESVTIRGMVEPYRRNIKNKPGDYILVNHSNNLPLAYLYSTKVNLNEYVGKNITLTVVRRPNNHFAFPAYFVLEVQ